MNKEKEPMNRNDSYTPVALYARVSSERQDVDLSVSAQMRALRDYADKNDYKVVREYVDEAESGRVLNRPEFRRMIDEAKKTKAPFNEILVWKFSRFTRKREHAVALKSMLRRQGVRVVSITEQAEDNPTGRLLEGIIESVDEFYSENLGQEVVRGMREAASRGFWVAPKPPYGYSKVKVLDGPKERPTLEPDEDAALVVKRIFDLAETRMGMLKIARALNDDGIASPRGKLWNKTTVHGILNNEAYTGTLVWGNNAKDNADPVRVEKAFPAVVTKAQFDRVNSIMRSRAPKITHPRRVGSSFLLSGLVKCYRCKRALSGRYSSRGTFPYYVCHSFVKRAPGSCDSPRVGRPPIRGTGRQLDSLQHPDRGQHSESGQGRGRADGRRIRRAAQTAGDHRVGACRRAGQAGTALRPRGDDDRVQHGRLRPSYPRPQGASGAP